MSSPMLTWNPSFGAWGTRLFPAESSSVGISSYGFGEESWHDVGLSNKGESMILRNHVAIVTGATSGLGFATAARLGRDGWEHVIVTGRTQDKARSAVDALRKQTGKAVFQPLALDLSDLASVTLAAEELGRGSHEIDLLLLNAGLVSGTDIVRNANGIERTFSASIIGHHALTMRLLNRGLLAAQARIVIAGSEVARDDVPLMSVVDLPTFAAEHTDGDRAKAIEIVARAKEPWTYSSNEALATAKAVVAWWAAALARRLPVGITVNAVSPGSRPQTGAARNMPWPLRWLVPTVMTAIGRLVGMAGPLEDGVQRYVDAANMGDEASGGFYTSPAGKLVGPLERQTQPHIVDEENQDAAWRAVVGLAGGIDLAE